MNKALFLDRDGTINVEKNYLYKIKEFDFIPQIFPICKKLQDDGYIIIVITNQSGVARGYYTEEQMNLCNRYMVDKFAEKGIKITDVFCCTSVDNNHPDRKPNPGMFLKAQKKYDIDMSKSISIGDKQRDIDAATNAGVKNNYFIDKISVIDGEHIQWNK